MKQKARYQAINELITSDKTKIVECLSSNKHSYINDILSNGFKGYDNMTNKEIEIEYNMMLNLTEETEKFEVISPNNK